MYKNIMIIFAAAALFVNIFSGCVVTDSEKTEVVITGILVSAEGSAAEVTQDAVLQFAAIVQGSGGVIPQDVIWSIDGAPTAGTAINAAGLLKVSASHTANAVLTIRATSDFNNSISGTKQVTVKAKEDDDEPGIGSAVFIVNVEADFAGFPAASDLNLNGTNIIILGGSDYIDSDCRWYLNGEPAGTPGKTYILNTSGLEKGFYSLTVIVRIGAYIYSETVNFEKD